MVTARTVVAAIAVSAISAMPVRPAGQSRDGRVGERTLYFSARGVDGAPVSELSASDLTLKVNGDPRRIVGVRRATAAIDVVLIVNDGGSGEFAAAVADFVQQMRGSATFSLLDLNRQPPKTLEAMTDASAVHAAVQAIGPRVPAAIGTSVADAVRDAAAALQGRRPARPVIVVLTTGGEPLDERGTDVSAASHAALADVRRSGASLHVVMPPIRAVGPLLGEGPGQSGGTRADIAAHGLRFVGDTLLSQYALTYITADATRPDTGVTLRANRDGVRIQAPTTVPR